MNAEEYLEHAEECECLAATAKLDTNKRALLESAKMWRRLAGRAKDDAGSDSVFKPQMHLKSAKNKA